MSMRRGLTLARLGLSSTADDIQFYFSTTPTSVFPSTYINLHQGTQALAGGKIP